MRDTQRTAIVTGAARGLGLALVSEFASNGWKAIGVARSEKPADYPGNAEYHSLDAADIKECQKFWELIATSNSELRTNGELCLVNNAGLYVRGSVLETKPETFEESIRANYLTGVNMTRVMLDLIEVASIVNIISTSAQQAKSTNSAYGSAKAGLSQFSRALQQEFSPKKYRITNLYPGTIRTHGEGPEVSAIEPAELSRFVRELAQQRSSFFIAEATILPPE